MFFNKIEQYGENIALISGASSISYRELAELADLYAEERLGRERRKLVFLMAENSIASIAAYLGALRAGHVVYLFGAGDEKKLSYFLDRYWPDVILRFSKGEVVVETNEVAAHSFHPDLCVLLSTSGSTGSPKLVKLSRRNIQSNAESIAAYLELSETDRAMTALQFNYSYGMSVVNSHLACGASIVLSDLSVTSPEFWTRFEESGATSFAGVPYTFEMLAKRDGWWKTPKLRYATQAGGRLAPSLVHEISLRARENGWKFFVMYGQTEAAPRMAYLPPDLAAEYPDCIGKAIPGGQLTIIGDDGAEITEPGKSGLLRYAGPNVMMGYAHQADDFATDGSHGYLDTGDVAEINERGLFRIVGRASRFVKPYGIRVGLDELQAHFSERYPGLVFTGNDELLVGAGPLSEPAKESLIKDIQGLTGLPPEVLMVLPMNDIPRLSNGKPDFPLIMARAQEFADNTRSSDADLDIHKVYERLAGEPVSRDTTFNDIAADSLNYVRTSLEVETYLGFLPENWNTLSLSKLEEMKNNPGSREGISEAEKLHFLNAFRVLMLLLGIPYHAAMIYHNTIDFRVSAPNGDLLATFLTSVIHSFRMPGFFIISGYLGWVMLRSSQPSRWWLRQFKNLGVSLTAALATVIPATLALVAIHRSLSGGQDFAAEYAELLLKPSTFWLQHLWFIPAALTISFLVAVVVSITRRVAPLAKIARTVVELANRFPNATLGVYALASAVYGLAVAVIRFKMGDWLVVFGVYDIQHTFLYMPPFLLGVLIARAPDFGRNALRLSVPLGCAAAASLAIYLWLYGSTTGWKPMVFSAIVLPCGIFISLFGLACWRRWWNEPNSVVSKLLDASLVIYIFHFPFVIGLGALGVGWDLHPWVAIPLVSAATLAASFCLFLLISRSRVLAFAFNGGQLHAGRTRL